MKESIQISHLTKMPERIDKSPGFTLLELSVTMLIMVLVLGVSLPSFSNMLESDLEKEARRMAKIIDELKAFLEEMGHPVVERWKAIPAEVVPIAEGVEAAAPPLEVPVSGVPIAAGGFKIILKDAKIHAKKVIIRRVEK